MFKRLNIIEIDIFLSKMLVRHVECARKRIQHYPTLKKAKEMLDECLRRFKFLSNIFVEKKLVQHHPT